MSIFERQKEFHSLVKYNITKNKQTGSGQIDNIRIAPITSLRINPNFVHYLYENYIVFVSGCNLVIYDCKAKTQKFLMRKHNQFKITSLSIGYVTKTETIIESNPSRRLKRSSIDEIIEKIAKTKEILICLGE